MATKKRKATAKVKTTPRYTTRSRKPSAKVREAAPAYTARSRQVPSKTKKRTVRRKQTSIAKKASPGEALWEILLALSDEEQGAFIDKLLETAEWREEIGDSILVIESRGQSTRPIEEFFTELDRERAK